MKIIDKTVKMAIRELLDLLLINKDDDPYVQLELRSNIDSAVRYILNNLSPEDKIKIVTYTLTESIAKIINIIWPLYREFTDPL